MVTFDPYEECAVCGRFHYTHDADPNRRANHNFKPRAPRPPADAVAEARLAERRAVLLRVANELGEAAKLWGYQVTMEQYLLGLAAKYEREAAEVK